MERLFNLDAQLLFDACVMALSMLVMFTFLSYLLFKPVRKLLEDRKQRVADEQESAKNDRKEAARIMENAKSEAELEKKHAMDDMKQEMISIASAMAGKVVAASIDTSVQDELIEETLKEMGEQTWLS